MAEKEKKLPVLKIRAGNISASIFRNKIQGEKGTFEVDTISLQRSYKKDEKSDWVNETISLRKNDLIKLKIIVDKLAEHQFLNKDDKEEA